MDDQRLGRAFRALRLRRGLRQSEVAAMAGVSPSILSDLEQGRIEKISLPALRRVGRALDVHVDLNVRLPYGEIDRLLNAGHAAMHEAVARYLDQLPGWVHAPEVSFAFYADHGIIDILAFHAPSRSVLVIELKTEFVSLDDLLSTMDVRMRHASVIAKQRWWQADSVSAWIVFADTDTNHRRVRDHAAALRSGFPSDGRHMRAWLRNPGEPIRALSFWANFGLSNAKAMAATRRRVRRPRPATGASQTSAAT